jgi:nicotinamidase/pyrazinamidase
MKTVFFDVDTQIDFLYPAGALYVPGAEKIVSSVARLNRYAEANSSLVVSTTDAHAEDDPEFRHWPPHCVAGTVGQLKPQDTLLEPRVSLPSARSEFTLGSARQVLLEKQVFDCFGNQNLPALLDRLAAERYIVYGVVTEVCVKCAAIGLLGTGRRVELVMDAIMHLDPAARDAMLNEFTARGGVLTTTERVTTDSNAPQL